MRALWDRAAIGWCRTFHPEPYWPVHGRYCCPTCMRTYPVPWREGGDSSRREHSRTTPRHRPRGFVELAFQKGRS
jgi:hypothetical protein